MKEEFEWPEEWPDPEKYKPDKDKSEKYDWPEVELDAAKLKKLKQKKRQRRFLVLLVVVLIGGGVLSWLYWPAPAAPLRPAMASQINLHNRLPALPTLLPIPPSQSLSPVVSLGEEEFEEGGALGVAWSPTEADGLLAVVGKRQILIYDLAQQGIRHRIVDEDAARDPFGFVDVAWSPDGTRLAAGKWHSVHVWQTAAYQRLQTFDVVQIVRGLVYRPEGLLVWQGEDTVTFWDAATGEPVPSVTEAVSKRAAEAHNASASADDSVVVTFSADASELLIKPGSEQAALTRIFMLAEGAIASVAMSPSDNWIGMGLTDGRIVLIDAQTYKPCYTIAAYESGVIDLAFSPDGAWLAAGSQAGQARIWQMALIKALTAEAGCHAVRPNGRPDWNSAPDALVMRIGYWGDTERGYMPDAQIWGNGRILWTTYDDEGRRQVWAGQLGQQALAELFDRFITAGYFDGRRGIFRDLYSTYGVEFYLSDTTADPLTWVSYNNGANFRRVYASDVAYAATLPDLAANEAVMDLIEFVRGGAGVEGEAYQPTSGQIYIYRVDTAYRRQADYGWPRHFTPLTEMENGANITGDTLAFVWQVVNAPLPLVRFNGRLYWISLEVPGVSLPH